MVSVHEIFAIPLDYPLRGLPLDSQAALWLAFQVEIFDQSLTAAMCLHAVLTRSDPAGILLAPVKRSVRKSPGKTARKKVKLNEKISLQMCVHRES